MTIPMYKIERTTIKMNHEHGCRYKELTSALNERQQSDRSYLAACYLLSADEEISDIAKQYISIEGIDFAAIRMRVKKTLWHLQRIHRRRGGIQSLYLARLQGESSRDGTERAILASDHL